MTLLSSRVRQVCPGPVDFALRRVLLEVGTDDDWAIVCAFSANHGVEGQVFALFVIAVAAAEVGVGLALVLLIYRNRRSIDIDQLDELKG